MLFNPTAGPINQFLELIGVADPPGWTTSSAWAMPAVIITSVWRDMGYYMVLYLAGLQAIPQEYYEAAEVDGANAWQRFWNITIPSLRWYVAWTGQTEAAKLDSATVEKLIGELSATIDE